MIIYIFEKTSRVTLVPNAHDNRYDDTGYEFNQWVRYKRTVPENHRSTRSSAYRQLSLFAGRWTLISHCDLVAFTGTYLNPFFTCSRKMHVVFQIFFYILPLLSWSIVVTCFNKSLKLFFFSLNISLTLAGLGLSVKDRPFFANLF